MERAMTYREALKARIAAATRQGMECPGKGFLFGEDGSIVARIASTGLGLKQADANYDLYYHARTDVELLLAQLERAEAALEFYADLDRNKDEAVRVLASLRAVLDAEVP